MNFFKGLNLSNDLDVQIFMNVCVPPVKRLTKQKNFIFFVTYRKISLFEGRL